MAVGKIFKQYEQEKAEMTAIIESHISQQDSLAKENAALKKTVDLLQETVALLQERIRELEHQLGQNS